MKYQIETIHEIMSELESLFQSHYDEVKDFDIPLQIDWDTYITFEEAHSLKIFTVRDESNSLIGYASFFIFENHHYANQLEANQDAIFISPTHRGIGRQFIDFIDIHLKEFGVKVTYHHVKPQVNWSAALVTHGYRHIENIFAKIL